MLAATQMPSTERIRAEVASDTIAVAVAERGDVRADVRAATDALAAARGDARRAKASLLPRINGFARYDWNSAATLYAGDRNWTVGVMASWNILGGASELADVQATAGRARAAKRRQKPRARTQASRSSRRAPRYQSRSRGWTSPSTRLRRARGTSHRQRKIRRRPRRRRRAARRAGGRDAERLALAQARWSAIVAAAERRRALGLDPATLASLDDTSHRVRHDAHARPLMHRHSSNESHSSYDQQQSSTSRGAASLRMCVAVAVVALVSACTRIARRRTPEHASTTTRGRHLHRARHHSGRRHSTRPASRRRSSNRRSARVDGTVTEVLVREGDRVETGQELVRIDARDLTAKSAQVDGIYRRNGSDAPRRHRAGQSHSRAVTQIARRLARSSTQRKPRLARAEAARSCGAQPRHPSSARSARTRSFARPFAGVVTKRFVDRGAIRGSRRTTHHDSGYVDAQDQRE